MSKAGCNLDRTSATKYARNHAFTVDELDGFDKWAPALRASGKNPAAILIARYIPHGDIPDDLPAPPPQEMTEEEKRAKWLANLQSTEVHPSKYRVH